MSIYAHVTKWGVSFPLMLWFATSVASAADSNNAQKLDEGLQKLHADNQAEISAARLALQKGTDSQEVTSFAHQMIDDHTNNDGQLTQLAQSKNLSLSGKGFDKETKSEQSNLRSLEKKSGNNFDRAYMRQMVKDHSKDEKSLRKLTNEAQDPQVKSFLEQTATTVAGHLQHAKTAMATLASRSMASPGTGASPAGGVGGGGVGGAPGSSGGTGSNSGQ